MSDKNNSQDVNRKKLNKNIKLGKLGKPDENLKISEINIRKKIISKLNNINENTTLKEAIDTIDDEHIIEYSKGALPNMPNYKKIVKEEMTSLSHQNLGGIPVTDKKGKVYYGRSLFASAERDVRFNHHFKKINEMKAKGIVNVWVTTHANCSKRCQPFQGRAYTLDGATRVINGIKLEPIEIATEIYVRTKSGKVWKNGLFGFNCRHDLKEFTPNSKPPVTYSPSEIERMRKIESKQREFERKLYQLDLQRAMCESAGDKESLKEAKKLREKYLILEKEYIDFCKKNNVKPQPYRYKTWLKRRM